MKNILEVKGYKAQISFDPEIEMFRGEFIDLNGHADFYASTIKDLKKEAQISLDIFLKMCEEDKIEPRKFYSGKFNLRLSQKLHEQVSRAAFSDGVSLNQWVTQKLSDVLDQDRSLS